MFDKFPWLSTGCRVDPWPGSWLWPLAPCTACGLAPSLVGHSLDHPSPRSCVVLHVRWEAVDGVPCHLACDGGFLSSPPPEASAAAIVGAFESHRPCDRCPTQVAREGLRRVLANRLSAEGPCRELAVVEATTNRRMETIAILLMASTMSLMITMCLQPYGACASRCGEICMLD